MDFVHTWPLRSGELHRRVLYKVGVSMFDWFRRRPRTPGNLHLPPEALPPQSSYVQDFMAAINCTEEAFGWQAPPRFLVAKDYLDIGRAMPDRHRPEEFVGQTAARARSLLRPDADTCCVRRARSRASARRYMMSWPPALFGAAR